MLIPFGMVLAFFTHSYSQPTIYIKSKKVVKNLRIIQKK